MRLMTLDHRENARGWAGPLVGGRPENGHFCCLYGGGVVFVLMDDFLDLDFLAAIVDEINQQVNNVVVIWTFWLPLGIYIAPSGSTIL